MWWKNKYIVVIFFIQGLMTINYSVAQELFIISEPASNIPAKAISARLTNKFMNGHRHSNLGNDDRTFMQRIVPEVAIGINKQFTLKISGYLSNYYQSELKFEGVNAYLKYRFFSRDDLHQHFRMAAFSRVSVCNNDFFFREINLEGDHSGINGGLVATQLLHKLAISATIGHVYLTDNIAYARPSLIAKNSLNYTLSAGYLLLPFHYKNYNQPNLNVYCELHGRNSLSEYETNIYDVFPALQLIIKSYMRFDLGYRYQIKSNAPRNAYSGFLIRFEYNFFNAF